MQRCFGNDTFLSVSRKRHHRVWHRAESVDESCTRLLIVVLFVACHKKYRCGLKAMKQKGSVLEAIFQVEFGSSI